jgi:hypothetical protein
LAQTTGLLGDPKNGMELPPLLLMLIQALDEASPRLVIEDPADADYLVGQLKLLSGSRWNLRSREDNV